MSLLEIAQKHAAQVLQCPSELLHYPGSQALLLLLAVLHCFVHCCAWDRQCLPKQLLALLLLLLVLLLAKRSEELQLPAAAQAHE
jgi:hypothetical protein